jgi:hypothetical protein
MHSKLFFFALEQVHNKLLTLLAIILEFGALIWYATLLLYLSSIQSHA